MTVSEFCEMFCDEFTAAIYDMAGEGEEVFFGSSCDAMDCDYSECEVLSVDFDLHDPRCGAVHVLNIDTEDY